MKGVKGFQRGNTAARRKGKHKKTLEQEKQRELFNKMVDAKWGEIITAQIEEGLVNYRARQYLIDQRIGRVKQGIEHSGIVTLEDLYEQAANNAEKIREEKV